MAWTEQSGWYDVAELLEQQIGSGGYMNTCLETVPVNLGSSSLMRQPKVKLP